MHDLGTTLVGVATPAGRGGVGCLRLSGERAFEIAGALFESAGPPARFGGRPRYGTFLDRERAALDHGYLVLFEGSSAFTGESTAELWCHGSPVVLAELMQSALAAGALAAGPGEFTYRALRRDKLDLARAEAVRDLVAARTRFQVRLALAQADGALSRRVRPLHEALVEWIARGEAAVEFVDESETHLPAGELGRAIEAVRGRCNEMLDGFRTGRVIRDGARLAVVGRPNAGKSSLFNRLLERDRAIVAEVAGTTRDTLEEELDLGGIPVRLVDTAGLREVVDPVESEGVRRAERARQEADLVLLVLDASREADAVERDAVAMALTTDTADEGVTVVVANKCDLAEARERPLPHPAVLRVSALEGSGIEALRRALREKLAGRGPVEDPVVTDSRHARALEQTLAALEAASEALRAGFSEELVVEDLRRALRYLGAITGDFTTEDLYDRIFSTFCIGK